MLPFFGRVGGKSKLAARLKKLVPKDYSNYVELFVGAGSLFLKLPPSKVEVLNDTDADIVNIWRDMQTHGEYVKDFKFNSSRKEFERLQKSNPRSVKKRLYRNLYISKLSFASNRTNYSPKVSAPLSKLKKNFQKYKDRLKELC